MLSLSIYDGNGLFLRLRHDMLEKLRFNKIAYFDSNDSDVFDEVLDIRQLDDNPETLDFLRKWISNDIFRVLCIYIAIPFHEYNNETENLNEIRKTSTLRFNDYYFSNTSNLLFPIGEITKDDLIILHKDLMILEENIINDSLPPEKNLFEIKPKKGVSQSKIRAKEQAKIIAKALWRTDKEQKIKIGEMANLVYAELYENGYIRQLPQDPMSLKEWIKEIAPSYAQDGGRPKKQ